MFLAQKVLEFGFKNMLATASGPKIQNLHTDFWRIASHALKRAKSSIPPVYVFLQKVKHQRTAKQAVCDFIYRFPFKARGPKIQNLCTYFYRKASSTKKR